jgi:hypothetical protein
VVICKIIEKKYVDQTIISASPQIYAANVTIHDNFHLLNVIFMDETIEMSDQCGSVSTRAELDTIQVGAKSPFWVYVASKFNSLSPDGDPNTEGIDFLNKVHFNYQNYESHSVTINPGNHNLFSSTKLRAMWNKIKGNYDLAMNNFTKSGNHSSSVTANVIKNILQLR